MGLYLSEPTAAVKDSYLAANDEFVAAGEPSEWSPENAAMVRDDFEGWVTKLKNRALGIGLPEGFVPDSIFWLIDGDRYIGGVSVRHVLTEKMRHFGGTIGYNIRPSERRKGYGKKILALALQKAAELGISEIIITCDVTNVGSQKIIEANGGKVIEDGVAVEERPVPIRRYKIAMPAALAMKMKTLKFRPELAQLIIDGAKTTTWRFFDDKDLQAGDMVELVNKATLQPFGRATITEIVLKPIRDLDDVDWEGHERFPNEEAMYATYRGYYPGREVGPETSVKILHFVVTK